MACDGDRGGEGGAEIRKLDMVLQKSISIFVAVGWYLRLKVKFVKWKGEKRNV